MDCCIMCSAATNVIQEGGKGGHHGNKHCLKSSHCEACVSLWAAMGKSQKAASMERRHGKNKLKRLMQWEVTPRFSTAVTELQQQHWWRRRSTAATSQTPHSNSVMMWQQCEKETSGSDSNLEASVLKDSVPVQSSSHPVFVLVWSNLDLGLILV